MIGIIYNDLSEIPELAQTILYFYFLQYSFKSFQNVTKIDNICTVNYSLLIKIGQDFFDQ